MIVTDTPGLPQELAAISRDTGWHAWRSRSGDAYSGEMYATHSRTRAEMHAIEDAYRLAHPGLDGAAPLAGSGVTVHAPTPLLLRYEIARRIHEDRCAA